MGAFPEESHLEEKQHYTKDEIDSITVKFCARCLSLHIMRYDSTSISEYCADCTSTDIATASINDWERLYFNKYGKLLINEERR